VTRVLAVLIAAVLGASVWTAVARHDRPIPTVLLGPLHDPEAALDRYATDVNLLVRRRLHHRITRPDERARESRLAGVARAASGCLRVDVVVQVGSGWEMRWAQEAAVASARADHADYVVADAEPAALADVIPQPFVSVVAGGWGC
jgi:hypothetical protein